MLVKDPVGRISLSEIALHDWVTANGIQPLAMHIYPQFDLAQGEESDPIKKVKVIANIKLRIKKKIEEIKASEKVITVAAGADNNCKMLNSESTNNTPI